MILQPKQTTGFSSALVFKYNGFGRAFILLKGFLLFPLIFAIRRCMIHTTYFQPPILPVCFPGTWPHSLFGSVSLAAGAGL